MIIIEKVMKAKYKNLLQELKFDGDLLVYKPSNILVFHRRVEIPINVVLDYQFKKVASIPWLILWINKYFHGQLKPVVRVLKPMCMLGLPVNFKNELLMSLDEVIQQNLTGVNIGLNHIPASAMRDFYLHRNGRLGTRWTSMRVTYAKQTDSPEAQQYGLFSELEKRAS